MKYDQPVGLLVEREQNAWAGGWFDATGYATYYTPGTYAAYHTGADLNLAGGKDTNAPVYASADGTVVYVGTWAGWQLEMVCLQHPDGMFSRYAHVINPAVKTGQAVHRGQLLGYIGDYTPTGTPSGDHCHFDITRTDLKAHPGDWPGLDIVRLKKEYVDPKEWINSHRVEEAPPVGKWTSNVVGSTPATSGTRVRSAPDPNAFIFCKIMPDQVVDGELTSDKLWVKMRVKVEHVSISGQEMQPSALSEVDGYSSSAFMKPASAPIPPPPVFAAAKQVLGVHELSGAGKSEQTLRLGGGSTMAFENATGAAQLSLGFPDAIVMHRKDFRFPLEPAQLLGAHGVAVDQVSQSRVWYRGANENDVATWDSSVEGIKRRAKFDIDCATILKKCAPNARWVAGGFAHGNPDFTQQSICDAIREAYSAAYNSGLIVFDIHSYSKSDPGNPKNYRYYAPIWFERRWEFLFTKCGFDPKVRGIVSTETGLEGGAGGFRWAGFTQDEFAGWCSYYLKIQQSPLVLNGISYPSPFLAGALFQWGNNYQGSGGWWGYGLDEYIPVLQKFWSGQLGAEQGGFEEPINIYAGKRPPDQIDPPRKAVY